MLSQVGHPDRRECKPSQAKKRTTANRRDDAHRPRTLPNQRSENKGRQGQSCRLHWALPTTAMAADREEDQSPSDTAGNASPSSHLLLRLPTAVSFSPVDTASISRGLQSLPDHSHPTWKPAAVGKPRQADSALVEGLASQGMSYL